MAENTVEEHSGEEVKEEKKKEPREKAQKEVKKASGRTSAGIAGIFDSIRDIYVNKYKTLFAISIIVFFLCLGLLVFNTMRTGELFQKDISLKGGVAVTISKEELNPVIVKDVLTKAYPAADINVRLLKSAGVTAGVVVESSDLTADDIISTLKSGLIGITISQSDYRVDMIGSSLGEAFFKQTTIAVFLAFLFMAVTVFLYFKNPLPSLFVVWCAFSDIMSTLAVVSIFNIRMSSASIAALLMLIGYSVDTDILLTARVLKGKHLSIIERILGSVKTGLMMTLTTIGALLAGYLLTQSDVIKQIMLILIIGLIFDMFYTWITNANILRIYMERIEKKRAEKLHNY